MKPKISTGYLTPQTQKKTKKKKNDAKGRLSDNEENAAESGIDTNMFAALMKCPEKKKMILELLASNKDAIEHYKKNEAKNLTNSPVGKVKNKKKACESPTALLRRRALEQMNTSPSRSGSRSSDLSGPNSRCSEACSEHSTSSIPFDKVLDGVVAYVEIKNKDQDRSSGAKAILKSMGAMLREKFTNDVTHVIFKDGSFMTYQKAKLMKIHLVSILWVEFCRKTMKRQPEKQYPALKSGFQDNETSMICSQMQKEYEDIIRDEYRRSVTNGTPLPSTRSFIDRRRTLMTPSVSNLNSSSTSFQTAINSMSSQDREVAEINGFHSEVLDAESLIINDPDCFSVVSGAMVNGSTVEKPEKRNSVSSCILKSVENMDSSAMEWTTSKSLRSDNNSHQKHFHNSDMELTMILNSNKTPKAKGTKSDIYNEKTPKLSTQKIPTTLFDRRKTICNSLLSSDVSSTNPISSDKSHNASSLISSDKSTNISGSASFAVPKSVKKPKRFSSSSFESNESFQLGKNKAKSSKMSKAELENTATAMSELNLSSDKETSKKSSVMSSLQISSEKDTKKRSRRSSSMSKLCLSSERNTGEIPAKKSISISDLGLKSNKNDKALSAGVSLDTNDKMAEKSSMSSLQVSSETNKKLAVSTSSMSTLQISTDSRRSSGRSTSKNMKNGSLNSDQPIFSSLNLSSEKASRNSLRQSKEKLSNTSFSSLDDGSSGGIKNLVETVLKKLRTPETTTVRKKYGQSPISSSRTSINSDDSEILSPKKNLGRTITNRQNLVEDSNIEGSSCAGDGNLSKNTDLELISTVTKRRKTLGSRSCTKTGTDSLQKDSSMDKHKVLVINIVKSPLNNNLQTGKNFTEIKESISLEKPRRETLEKRTKNISKAKDSREQNDEGLGENAVKTPLSINLKKGTRNLKKRVIHIDRKLINTCTSESDMDPSSSSKIQSDHSSDSSTKSKKKLRKLYNPDDPINAVIFDDEREREEKRLAFKRRKSNEGVFLNPAEVLKSVDNRQKEASLNESTESESSDDVQTPPKRTKKQPSLNSSADEQRELLNEVINKEINKVVPKTPKSTTKDTPKGKTPAETPSRRKSTRFVKPTQKFMESQKSDIKPINRRSTLDFQPVSSSKKVKKVEKMKMPSIVCTKLHKSDVQMFTQIIKKLGRFTVENEVSNKTTHLVAGEPKRTINMLRAISRGCWVLKFDWVLQSLEAGKWLREEDFEVHDFSPAVQKCRLERQAFGPRYTLDVFETCPPIYVAPSTNPRCSDLKELITICRGRVVTTPRMAKIMVGEYLNQEYTVCVNETWVLDCITFNKKIAFKKQYLLPKEKDSKRKSLAV